MIKTKDSIKAFGDEWMELFPKGRKVYCIIDALHWEKNKATKYRKVIELTVEKNRV